MGAGDDVVGTIRALVHTFLCIYSYQYITYLDVYIHRRVGVMVDALDILDR